MITGNFEKAFFNVSQKTRWLIIVFAFIFIAALDFSTPSEYILAYLYLNFAILPK